MEDITQVIALVSGVVALIILVGAAAVLFKGSYNKARIEGLDHANDELRKRVSDLEASEERHELKEAALEARCQHLEEENGTLLAGLTQKAEVNEVKIMLEAHHTEAMTAWAYIGSLLERLIEVEEDEDGQ